MGTTALVAAATLPLASASAQGIKLGLGGYMNNFFGVGDIDSDEAFSDDDFNPTNLFSDGEVHFSGEFTADNGISFGANIQLESFQSDPDQIDENFGYMEGSFGRLQFGSENTAAYLMQFSGPEVGAPINSGWVTAFIPSPGDLSFRTPGLSTFIDIGNDENRLTYFTPRVFGFQFGASYTPTIVNSGDGSNNPANEDTQDRNGVAFGANFVRSFNGFDVALSGGFQWAERGDDTSGGDGQPGDTRYMYSTGLNVSYAGFTIGGSGAVETGGGNSAGRAFDAGVSYQTGPWTFNIYYFNSLVDGASSRNASLESGKVAAQYALAPGVRLTGTVLYAEVEGTSDLDGDGTRTADEFGKRDGIVGIVGINFSF